MREPPVYEERGDGDGDRPSVLHFHPAEIQSLVGALLTHLNMFCPICATREP